MNFIVDLSLRWLLLKSVQQIKMQSKLPNHKHSQSNLFTKVGDAASALHVVKGVYDAGKFLYKAGWMAAPYMWGAAAVLYKST